MFDTIVRRKNLQLFLLVDGEHDINFLSKASKVNYTHVRRLLKTWKAKGFVDKVNTHHGPMYTPTAKGMELRFAAEELEASLKLIEGS